MRLLPVHGVAASEESSAAFLACGSQIAGVITGSANRVCRIMPNKKECPSRHAGSAAVFVTRSIARVSVLNKLTQLHMLMVSTGTTVLLI
jgi:hypothetical protein